MEEALVSLERNRLESFVEPACKKSRTNDLKSSCSDFARALQELAILFSEGEGKGKGECPSVAESSLSDTVDPAASAAASASASSKPAENDVTQWLYNLSATIPSPLDTLALSTAILSACQRGDEMQIQSALFDTLGESERAMEVLFDIVPRALEISNNVTEESLQRLDRGGGNAASGSGFGSSNRGPIPTMDPELERLQLLRQEAMDTAEYASLLKVQLEGDSGYGGSNATHTVKRTSDKALAKRVKQAAKAATKAFEAAKAAGAIIDDDEFGMQGYDNAALADEAAYQHNVGIHQMSTDEFHSFRSALAPENTKQHYEKKTLGGIREQFDGYETVTIPATILKAEQRRERIVIEEVMNTSERKAFAGTKSLNPMQSTVFEAAFSTSENLLICAPTGAGKTNVAMLTVVAHLREKGIIKNENDPYAAYQHIGEDQTSPVGRKIVYIAPMKALAQEVVEKFSSKLKALKVVVKELTGDMQLSRAEAERADILVTTPEKWDVVTRKGGDGSLGQTCGLLIIDEVHLLADERGAVIESVVARLHRLVESSQRQVRIVGLSATLPNYKDVATFLRVDHQRGLFFFGPEHRPVPLQQQFIGVSEKNRFRREKKMNDVCYNVVADSLKRGYQVMVFVHSRKGTGETIEALAETANKRNQLEELFITKGSEENADAHSRYADKAEKSRNREVSKHFQNGMGIHHAGMLRNDRKLTEQMFADGAIKVLSCTATLAWGINLPAHTVIIKGTDVYNPEKGKAMDLSILDVMQIFGRAGRPQFDTSGEATMITSQDSMARYLDKLVKEVPIESTFIKQLADHLNAEIVGGTVTNIQEAAEWLQYTYLHVRMMRNPIGYGINATDRESDPMLKGRSLELVKEAANVLDQYKMTRFDTASGNLAVTDLGRVASHFYIRAESVARFNEMLSRNPSPFEADLFDIICNAQEFENVQVRAEELEEMDKLKKECPLEVKSPVEEYPGKCCVLMQGFISASRLKSFTLISDTNYVASNAGRVARALFEMCLKRGMAGAALKLLRIAKTVDKRIWWQQTPLRQFGSELPQNVFRALESRTSGSHYNSFDSALSLLDMQHNEVGQFCHWQKGGRKVQNFVSYLPNLDISCNVQPVTKSILRFQVTIRPIFDWHPRWHGNAEGFWLWVEDSGNNRIYHQEYVLFSRRTHPSPINLELTIPAFDPLPPQYFIRAVSDSWVGSEVLLPVSFQHLMMPDQSMPYTDLMDLTPLPTSALENKKFEQLYTKFETFNPIQTQLFHVLYHTGAPVLLGAPTGSGKTIVAELTLLRMKRLNPKAKCVYIAPLKSLARERLKEWKKRLGAAPLNWKVLEMSGDTHHDKRTLRDADVLVATPEKYDLISRGWRGEIGSDGSSSGKDFIKDVRLLIIDEIHLLGEERGAVLEAIVSRTRFISRLIDAERQEGGDTSSQKYESTRIVGLSTAVANPYDLADWIGIDVDGIQHGAKIGLYNFRPSVRPIPMEVHMSGFAGRHYCPRMATMNKPCYAAIKEHSPSKPVIIFVASRRQTRLTALDLISYAASDFSTFLGCSDEYAASVASTLSDASLRHTLSFGIGLHHAGLPSSDREVVETMFLNGDIQVLVATATLAWGVNLPAHLVIVKGTEFFDGKESRYVDYPVTDVLQMMGRAGRPQFDDKGVACVFVEESKKNFYKKFLYHPLPVESCLGPRMAENLNAEIAIGTVTSVDDCVGYLDWTFFARRARMNPSYYGVIVDKEKKNSGSDDISEFLNDTVLKCLDELSENQCVLCDDDGFVEPTHLGIACSKYYINHKTPQQMQKGARDTRKLMKLSGLTPNDCPSKQADKNGFVFNPDLEEVSVASILYTLVHTHEFAELPVRHTEDQLNADLSEGLPWGGMVPLVGEKGVKKNLNYDDDIMAEPFTKGYLLIQANITRSKLPITDYINDMRSVLDQLPRLLAAMESIALNDMATDGSFDLFCMFAITRQVIATRTMPGVDALFQISIPKEKVNRLKKRGLDLRGIMSMGDKEASKSGLSNKQVSFIKAMPSFSVHKSIVTFKLDKTSGKSRGILEFEFALEKMRNIRRKNNNGGRGNDRGSSFVAAIGTANNNLLLGHKSIMISPSNTRTIKIEFDWNVATSCSDANGGGIRLRILSTDVRGLDLEYFVPLDTTK